jgi:hypothetical protein
VTVAAVTCSLTLRSWVLLLSIEYHPTLAQDCFSHNYLLVLSAATCLEWANRHVTSKHQPRQLSWVIAGPCTVPLSSHIKRLLTVQAQGTVDCSGECRALLAEGLEGAIGPHTPR